MLKKFLKKRLNQKGLTLVELLAVVVILGIIAAIAVPSVGGIIDNSKRDAAVANAVQVLNSVKLANASGVTPIENASHISDYIGTITNPFSKAAITDLATIVITNGTSANPTVNMANFGCNATGSNAAADLAALTGNNARNACAKP